MTTKLDHVRIDLAEANAFVKEHHRHHKPVVGHLFSIGAILENKIVGVAIVGRPVARFRDDGLTTE
ncbi:MAG TPA: XF1762 family protein, partial [Anaerolineae bacterium]|nr:XF1762 family protein [Anaerolineae bacterium]